MNESRSELLRYKSLILGDASVGKSSILRRYERDEFNPTYEMTIGVDFIYKELIVEGKRMNWRIWDTAGQEKYRSIVTSYLKGLDGIIFAFDVTSRESFASVTEWVNYFSSHASNSDIPKILVGNKTDNVSCRIVTFEAAQKLAGSISMPYFDVSAKTGANVAEAFNYLAKLILRTGITTHGSLGSPSSVLNTTQTKTKKCC